MWCDAVRGEVRCGACVRRVLCCVRVPSVRVPSVLRVWSVSGGPMRQYARGRVGCCSCSFIPLTVHTAQDDRHGHDQDAQGPDGLNAYSVLRSAVTAHFTRRGAVGC
jgi:hypothetical protein